MAVKPDWEKLVKRIAGPNTSPQVTKAVAVYLSDFLDEISKMDQVMMVFHSTIRDIQQCLMRTLLEIQERTPRDPEPTPKQ